MDFFSRGSWRFFLKASYSSLISSHPLLACASFCNLSASFCSAVLVYFFLGGGSMLPVVLLAGKRSLCKVICKKQSAREIFHYPQNVRGGDPRKGCSKMLNYSGLTSEYSLISHHNCHRITIWRLASTKQFKLPTATGRKGKAGPAAICIQETRKFADGDLRVDLVKKPSQDLGAHLGKAVARYRIPINMKMQACDLRKTWFRITTPCLWGRVCIFFVFMVILGITKRNHKRLNVPYWKLKFAI